MLLAHYARGLPLAAEAIEAIAALAKRRAGDARARRRAARDGGLRLRAARHFLPGGVRRLMH